MFISWYDKDIPNNRSDILAEHVERDVLERLRIRVFCFQRSIGRACRFAWIIETLPPDSFVKFVVASEPDEFLVFTCVLPSEQKSTESVDLQFECKGRLNLNPSVVLVRCAGICSNSFTHCPSCMGGRRDLGRFLQLSFFFFEIREVFLSCETRQNCVGQSLNV